MEFEEIKNSSLEVDRIMETVYDDMEYGIKEDLIQWSSNIKDRSDLRQIYIHMSSIFLNYVLNRLGEFKDPEKAEDKAHLGRKIIVDLINSEKSGGKEC